MSFLNPEALLALILGSLYGAIFGAIPGLTATLAISLAIPILLFLGPQVALAALIGITATAIFAGDIGSVLVRMPGTPASAAYTEELHEVAQKRSPAFALGLSALPSAIGSLIGLGFLVVGSLGLVALAKQFSSFEYFWLVLLGIISGVLAVPSILKGALAFGLGMLLATIGYDPALGHPRFTFGQPNLLGGIDFIVALIAFFGVSEVLHHLLHKNHPPQAQTEGLRGRGIFRAYFQEAGQFCWKERGSLVRSSVLGTFVGFLPGAGSDIAAWISSNLRRMRGGRPEQVALDGTTANNAAVAGAWIPAMALGAARRHPYRHPAGDVPGFGHYPRPRAFQQARGLGDADLPGLLLGERGGDAAGRLPERPDRAEPAPHSHAGADGEAGAGAVRGGGLCRQQQPL